MNPTGEVYAEDVDVRVELEDIGEGYDGEYNELNPHDKPLMRFTVLCRSGDGIWVPVEDASYCTLIPATTRRKTLVALAEIILDHVKDDVRSGVSIKKKCEHLSWIRPGWIKGRQEILTGI